VCLPKSFGKLSSNTAQPLWVGGIQIFDANGRLAMTQNAAENRVDVSGLCSGVYSMQITTKKGILYQQKMLKR